jgi:hypothetical protein
MGAAGPDQVPAFKLVINDIPGPDSLNFFYGMGVHGHPGLLEQPVVELDAPDCILAGFYRQGNPEKMKVNPVYPGQCMGIIVRGIPKVSEHIR